MLIFPCYVRKYVFSDMLIIGRQQQYNRFSMPRKLPRFLTPLEVKAMFEAAGSSQRDLLLLKCLFYLGLRNSEAQKLNIGDIDFINKNAKVVQGKGGKDRYILMPSGFAEELRIYAKTVQNGHLFSISDRHIRRIVKGYARKAGVRKPEEVHPHTLRHSYATHLQNLGTPLNAIQELLGHERLETTTIYTHMGKEKIREYIEKAFEGF